jgi:4-cresol dehydrogenase (hydroxylating)
MTKMLPPNVAEPEFAAALDLLRAALGDDAVLTDSAELAEFRDPYAPPSADDLLPSAVVRPGSVEDVQAVLAIANTYRLPLWTVSQGKNNGYGGPAPRVVGSVVVSLARMNRVLEINEELAYVVVEPGVRFFDLHDAVRAGGHRLIPSMPDLGWGSVIGNTLDHGFGYTPYGEHASSQCGMEVVLADGSVMRTGMGAMTDGVSWHVHKRGFGPSADGMFMQSNLGIVTKIGMWLMPMPEVILSCGLKAGSEDALEPIIDTLRELMLEGTIRNLPALANALTISTAFTRRDHWHEGAGPVPEEAIDRIVDELGLGRWNGRFAIYGPDAVVDAQYERARTALEAIPGVELTANRYPGDAPADAVHPADYAHTGIPTLDLLETLKWHGSERGGHLGFSPVAPLVGSHVRRLIDIVRPIMERHGLDCLGGLICTPRSVVYVFEFYYDALSEDHAARVLAACRECIHAAAEAGYGEYRAHIDVMDLVADHYDFNDHALMRFNERIKDALDPNGILSPGKQGIWPASMRRSFVGRDDPR